MGVLPEPKGQSKFIKKDSRGVALKNSVPTKGKAVPTKGPVKRFNGYDFLRIFIEQMKEALKVLDHPNILPATAFVDMNLALTYSFGALKVIDNIYPNLPGRVILNDAFRTAELIRTYIDVLNYIQKHKPDVFSGKEKLKISLRKYLNDHIVEALDGHTIHIAKTHNNDMGFIRHKKEVNNETNTKLQ